MVENIKQSWYAGDNSEYDSFIRKYKGIEESYLSLTSEISNHIPEFTFEKMKELLNVQELSDWKRVEEKMKYQAVKLDIKKLIDVELRKIDGKMQDSVFRGIFSGLIGWSSPSKSDAIGRLLERPWINTNLDKLLAEHFNSISTKYKIPIPQKTDYHYTSHFLHGKGFFKGLGRQIFNQTKIGTSFSHGLNTLNLALETIKGFEESLDFRAGKSVLDLNLITPVENLNSFVKRYNYELFQLSRGNNTETSLLYKKLLDEYPYSKEGLVKNKETNIDFFEKFLNNHDSNYYQFDEHPDSETESINKVIAAFIAFSKEETQHNFEYLFGQFPDAYSIFEKAKIESFALRYENLHAKYFQKRWDFEFYRDFFSKMQVEYNDMHNSFSNVLNDTNFLDIDSLKNLYKYLKEKGFHIGELAKEFHEKRTAFRLMFGERREFIEISTDSPQVPINVPIKRHWDPELDNSVRSYHSGGFVGGGSGSGSEVMAVLQEGEFVVPLDTINNFLSLVNTAKESNAALSQMKSSISAAKEQTKQISDTKNSPSIEEAFEYSKKVSKNMDVASAGAKMAASVLTGLPNLDALNELTKNITNPDSAANAKSLSDQLRTISGDARQIGYAFMDIDENIGRAVQSTGDLGYGISSVVDAFSAEKFNLGSLGQGMQGIASGIGGIFGFEAGSDGAEVMNGISSAGSALASLATGDIGGAMCHI